MRLHYGLGIVGCLLLTALSFSQTDQQPTNPQPTSSQSTNPQPASQRPIKPSAVAAAASASRLAHQSAPPTKVIRNHDISDGSSTPEAGASEPRPSDVAAVRAAQDRENQEEDRKVQQFEAQGKTFTNQIRVQKGKIIDLQNQAQNLRDQLYAWSDSHRHVNPDICWTAEHDTEYYRSWCDVGRNLKSAMEASQGQLAREKVRLEQMQENIRRAGYGNAVYDPD